MIHRYIEVVLVMALSAILTLILPSFIIFVATDVLPINKDLTVEEFIDTVVEDGSTYDYIQESDYILITELEVDSDQRYHLAFKGKSSGYIDTSYYSWSQYYNREKIEDKYVEYNIKKHRDKYLLDFTMFDKNISLYDNNDNELDSITSKERICFFKVLENDKEDYIVYCKVNNNLYKLVDFQMIERLAKDNNYSLKYFKNYLLLNYCIIILTGLTIFLLLHFYSKYIIKVYVQKINKAICAKDEEQKNVLLQRAYKRQKGNVYNKICEELGISVDENK